jgi:hypothetical protein
MREAIERLHTELTGQTFSQVTVRAFTGECISGVPGFWANRKEWLTVAARTASL